MIKEWGDCVVDGVPTLKCLEVIFGNILVMASAFIVLALFIMLVVGAFNYLSSFGNPEKIKKAQGTIKFAIIGFALFVASYLILNIIDILFLGGTGKIFRFELPGP
jgi:heme/copper-type cytochrome/quinol oxidase subunit 2